MEAVIHSAVCVFVCVRERKGLPQGWCSREHCEVDGNGKLEWRELEKAQPYWESQQKCVCQAGGVILDMKKHKTKRCICNLRVTLQNTQRALIFNDVLSILCAVKWAVIP